MRRKVSVVVPVRNEGAGIEASLAALMPWREAGHEVIVVDGSSTDDSARRARSGADTVLVTEPGRARQMNRGAARACGDALLFLHADTRLPDGAPAIVAAALERRTWGRFDVRLSGTRSAFRVIERMMNLRSCLTGIATGDQAIFVRRGEFEELGGFPEIPLMEDIEFSRRMRRFGRPACVRPALVTSSRRWEYHGVMRTVLLMWSLRLRYFLGADPAVLARAYARSTPPAEEA